MQKEPGVSEQPSGFEVQGFAHVVASIESRAAIVGTRPLPACNIPRAQCGSWENRRLCSAALFGGCAQEHACYPRRCLAVELHRLDGKAARAERSGEMADTDKRVSGASVRSWPLACAQTMANNPCADGRERQPRERTETRAAQTASLFYAIERRQ